MQKLLQRPSSQVTLLQRWRDQGPRPQGRCRINPGRKPYWYPQHSTQEPKPGLTWSLSSKGKRRPGEPGARESLREAGDRRPGDSDMQTQLQPGPVLNQPRSHGDRQHHRPRETVVRVQWRSSQSAAAPQACHDVSDGSRGGEVWDRYGKAHDKSPGKVAVGFWGLGSSSTNQGSSIKTVDTQGAHRQRGEAGQATGIGGCRVRERSVWKGARDGHAV